MMIRTFVAFAAAFVFMGTGQAQENTTAEGDIQLRTASIAGAGTENSPARVSPPGPSFNFSLDSKRARVALAVTRNRTLVNSQTREGQPAITESWSFGLGAPLDRSEDNFITVDGFADAIALEASLIRYRQRVRPFVPGADNDPRPRLRQLRTLASAVCMVDRQQEHPNETEIQRERACAWSAIIANGLLPDYLSRSRYEEYYTLSRITVEGPMLMYGGNLKIGGETNEFMQPVSFDAADQVDMPWKVSAFIGWINPDARNAIVLGVAFQRSFQDQASQTICSQPTPTSTRNCRSGPVGPPQEIDSPMLVAEYRQAFGRGDRHIAMALRVEHDFERDLTELTLPLYLFSSSEGSGLNGGFQLRWNSEEDQIIPGIFLSASPYRLFGQ